MNKELYRYEILYSNSEEETSVVLRVYPVVRETEYTYFINPRRPVAGDKLKRLKKDAMKTFAFDTKEKALKHFINRTKRRLGWYEYWTNECEKGLELRKEYIK